MTVNKWHKAQARAWASCTKRAGGLRCYCFRGPLRAGACFHLPHIEQGTGKGGPGSLVGQGTGKRLRGWGGMRLVLRSPSLRPFTSEWKQHLFLGCPVEGKAFVPACPLALPAGPQSVRVVNEEAWERKGNGAAPVWALAQFFPGGCRTCPVPWSICPLSMSKARSVQQRPNLHFTLGGTRACMVSVGAGG